MKAESIKRILNSIGISSYENISLPQIRCIYMSSNQAIKPYDILTFDFTNKLIKIKERIAQEENENSIKYIQSKNQYDIYLDMNDVIGFETVNSSIGLS